ncbi:MAG: hypothetical protein JSR11_07745 [Bacteroidetes bacterium]|nr:hypothetical protein [Bacteroidota bacterium]
MKAEELRFGNYVLYDKKECYIAGITYSGVRIFDGYGFDKTTPFGCIKPIPLTIKLLKRFGAKHFDGESWELLNNIICYAECYNCFHDKDTGVELKFVHQLQNLYYCLTGEKLVMSAS